MFIDTRERPAGEVQQKVGRLKLSEAIRIGARIRPRCRGAFFDGERSCAFGAAYEGAMGHPIKGTTYGPIFELWPEILPIAIQITTRNDSGESRESIADWLESQGL
jgi:hypothetical protein